MENTSIPESSLNPPKTPLSLSQANQILSSHLKENCSVISIQHLDRVFNTRNTTYVIQTPFQDYILRFSSSWGSKTEAEVAAIRFLSDRVSSSLPLPKVVGWCSNPENSPTGYEYILMERLPGIPLGDIWSELRTSEKKIVVKKLVSILKELQSVTCSKLGSFRFKEGDETVAEVGPLFKTGSGPFASYPEYVGALIKTELELLKTSPILMEGEEMSQLVKRIQNFAQRLTDSETPLLPKHVENVPFVFGHGDLHAYNILLERDTLRVSGIVDFEFAGSYTIDADWFKCFSFAGASEIGSQFFGDGLRTMSDSDRETDFPDEKELNELRDYFFMECGHQGVITPENIPGHAERAVLHYFVQYICPWWIADGVDPLPEGWRKDRETARERIQTVLNIYGM